MAKEDEKRGESRRAGDTSLLSKAIFGKMVSAKSALASKNVLAAKKVMATKKVFVAKQRRATLRLFETHLERGGVHSYMGKRRYFTPKRHAPDYRAIMSIPRETPRRVLLPIIANAAQAMVLYQSFLWTEERIQLGPAVGGMTAGAAHSVVSWPMERWLGRNPMPRNKAAIDFALMLAADASGFGAFFHSFEASLSRLGGKEETESPWRFALAGVCAGLVFSAVHFPFGLAREASRRGKHVWRNAPKRAIASCRGLATALPVNAAALVIVDSLLTKLPSSAGLHSRRGN